VSYHESCWNAVYSQREAAPHSRNARRDRALSAILRDGGAIAILTVFSQVLRLALVAWLGISALAWGVIFAMTGLFETVRKLQWGYHSWQSGVCNAKAMVKSASKRDVRRLFVRGD
jgi:hypothetical protein